MKIFIIHGTEGDGNENWFAWLKEQLEGHEIISPQFPTPDGQTLKAWREEFEPYMDQVEGSILIGHSIGCAFILDILERSKKKAKAVFLVAGFMSMLGSEYDDLIETFVDRDINWHKIRESAGKFYLYNSDNDPYVPQEMGMEIAKEVNGHFTLVYGAGHFNEKAGYTKFDMLLDDMRKFI